MKFSQIAFLSLGFFLFANCQYDKPYPSSLNGIPANTYYSSDIFKDKQPEIYGTWEVVGTSGGFGGQGYAQDFDYLVIKPNAIFGIIRDSQLLTTGKMEIVEDPSQALLVRFISEADPTSLGVEILSDSEKFIQIDSDNLTLNAPCCDRFNTHFKRVE